MLITTNSTLLFIGDSITDCDRARPLGTAATPTGLGLGYVALVNALLTAAHPAHPLTILNTGISGNTVRDLQRRWQFDVLAHRPDWLAIMIGINDVWRHFKPFRPSKDAVPLPEYTRTLTDLVRQTRPRLQGLILLTPYLIEPDRADPMRQMMDAYGAAVRQVAAEYQALLVDTQAAFDAALQHLTPQSLADDRIHPNLPGHMILARTFLNSLDFSW